MSNAYDSLWQCGLIYKLYQTKLDPGLVHTVNSYLNDRSAFVQVKNEKSYTFELKSGVPQGGNLSPLLFNVFINDAPENNNIELSLFADDIAAYSAHEITNVAIDDMTDYLAIMSEWLNLWFLSLNTKKCNAIVFNPDEPNPPSLNIQISNTPIPWSPWSKPRQQTQLDETNLNFHEESKSENGCAQIYYEY